MYPIPWARFFPHGPCPHCGKHVRPRDTECTHCGQRLSEEDREGVRNYADAQHQKGIRIGVFFFSAVVFALVVSKVFE